MLTKNGAGGETRTLTAKPPDPKSGVSTNFTTPANQIIACIVHKKIFKSRQNSQSE